MRKGSDVTLLAIGSMVRPALEAAGLLAGRGIRATVINARFVKPLDEECILHYAGHTGRIFTIEEHVLHGGFGSAVLEMISAKGLKDIRVYCLGIPDTFVEHGSPALLKARYGLTADQIARAVTDKVVPKSRIRRLRVVSDNL